MQIYPILGEKSHSRGEEVREVAVLHAVPRRFPVTAIERKRRRKTNSVFMCRLRHEPPRCHGCFVGGVRVLYLAERIFSFYRRASKIKERERGRVLFDARGILSSPIAMRIVRTMFEVDELELAAAARRRSPQSMLPLLTPKSTL